MPLDPDRLLTLIRHHHPRINQGTHHWQAGQLFLQGRCPPCFNGLIDADKAGANSRLPLGMIHPSMTHRAESRPPP